MATAVINSRKELKEVLQNRMAASYEDIREDQRLDEDKTYLKSYLIESDRDDFSSNIVGTDKYSVETVPTEDKGFVNLKVRNGSESTERFYLDKLDDRFWSIHTLAKSRVSDRFIEKVVFPRYTKLDFPWLSNQFLRTLGEENNFRSFSLKFEDEFGNLGNNSSSGQISGMSMRLWGGTAQEVLDKLSDDETIGSSTSLSNIGIRREVGDGEVVLEDITNQGKFTARGDSVDGHFYQLNIVKERYHELLQIIEEEYSISRGTGESSSKISGSPLTINLDREITDFEDFFDTILTSKKPFRLWGVYNKIGDDYYRVSGVDQHTGDEVNLEVSSEWIRVYLPEGSCGNVVLRLYSIIQHYFDSRAELVGIDHGIIV
ncbi:hypothetical protein HTZ84_15090 [Haloterrigena sp. SYSU A558-1]|uniref:Uncharacterized protein n=1 Tax=Haloterrigena gelatinilytica TaxID=2741724 RepID=A0ABX2LBG3_9EURY|nr:hypothetical protein [Haloterrigena gelatinilytica]NUC73615.1 hypothetical protein [Haloterrigena gelatinilytica]